MKHILLTGATGFVASHLIPYLDDRGWKITAAVRRSCDRFPPQITTINVGNIDGNTNWQAALPGMDIVIHLAGRAHILREEVANPEAEFFKVNTEGTANLVRQSVAAGVKHFVFVSSIGAMATLADKLLTENSPCQPDTPYGRSKLQAERALIEIARQSAMTWTILRPPLVYGVGNPGNMERLMKLIDRGFPLPFGSIANRRSLIYVGNLVDAIATCLTRPQARNQCFLVSDDRDISTAELIRQIAHYRKRPCYLLPVPPAALKFLGHLGDRLELLLKRPLPFNSVTLDRLSGSLVVDSSHIQTTLNWQPPYTLDRGLAETLR